MMHRALICLAVVLLAGPPTLGQDRRESGAGRNESPQIDWNTRMPWGPWSGGVNGWWSNFPRTAQVVEPFKIFDNVYYVGVQTAQALLVRTSDGLMLIDGTWAETADLVLASIRKAGFDPADIKYILISHGHTDHFGGVGRIKQLAAHARVGTSAADWDLIKSQQGTPDSGLPLERDLVIDDGDVIRLGDTALKMYVTPGHSPGSLAFDIPGRIGRRTYRILNPRVSIRIPAAMTAAYITSIERLKQLGPWDGYLPEHPYLAMRPAQISAKDFYVGPEPPPKPAGPNASVQGAAAIDAFLDQLLKVAREKLAYEQRAGGSRQGAVGRGQWAVGPRRLAALACRGACLVRAPAQFDVTHRERASPCHRLDHQTPMLQP